MSKVALSFTNASCAHCVRIVTRLLTGQEGVAAVEIDGKRGQVWVGYNAGRISPESIRVLMERSGFPSRLIAKRTAPARERVLDRAA